MYSYFPAHNPNYQHPPPAYDQYRNNQGYNGYNTTPRGTTTAPTSDPVYPPGIVQNTNYPPAPPAYTYNNPTK